MDRDSHSPEQRKESDEGFEILRLRIHKLREKGYEVAKLQALLDSKADIAAIVDGFEKFDKSVFKLQELQNKYYDILENNDLPLDEEFDRLFYDPVHIEVIEQKLHELEQIDDMHSAMMPLFDQKLERWKQQGYIIDSLLPTLNLDMETIKRQFENFGEKIEIIEDIKTKLEQIAVPNEFKSEFESIKAIMDDPSKLSEIQFELMELEQKISMVSREKSAYVAKLEKWKGEGFNISCLESVMDRDIEVIRAVFKDFDRDIGRLLELKTLMEKIDTKGSEERVNHINEMMCYPDRIYEIETEIRELAALDAERKTRHRLQKKLDNWKWACLEVEPLEKIVNDDSLPIAAVEDAFKIFNEQYNILLDLRYRIIELNPEGFEEEINSIFSKITDVDKIPEIREQIKKLEAEIQEIERKRMSMKDDAFDEEKYKTELEQLKLIEEQIALLDLESLQSKIKELDSYRSS